MQPAFYKSPRPNGVFPHSSVGKESSCNAGDPSWIPGLERSPGEGIGYPLQYSWASLVAQLVKSLFTMQETWVQSLGWEDPLEKRKATHSSILAWRSPWICKELDTTARLSLFTLMQWFISKMCKQKFQNTNIINNILKRLKKK